ncbi:MAG TPA: FliH/SctL family protein [Candidatus Binataceae bacterium]|nr:FliH/SctL family protein [Candidatus Binataceae bacterium]
MERSAVTYTFPTPEQLHTLGARPSVVTQETLDDGAIREAIARGYAQGFDQGRAEAQSAAAEAARAAQASAREEGRAEGQAEVTRLVDALSLALDQLAEERSNLVADTEKFCVDLSLAIAGRLIETSAAQTEFVSRTAKAALAVLAPQIPTAIFVNSADLEPLANALKSLPVKEDPSLNPGEVRVEAGRLVVEAGIQTAFETIKTSVLETAARRTANPATKGNRRARKR